MADPQSPIAEDNVLGAMLLSPNAAATAAAILKPDMFYRESNKNIFKVMVDLQEQGIPTDPVTVTSALSEAGQLDEVGRTRIEELTYLVPVTANIIHYCNIVRKDWKRRLVQKELKRIENDLETLDDPVGELESVVLKLEQEVDEKHELVIGIQDLIAAKREAMDKPEAGKAGVPSPFSFIPDLVGGRLYVLGGYMGDGKTSAALQFASSAARAGEKVGIASAEMSKVDLFDRWACQMTGLDYWKVKNPWLLDPHQRQRLETAMEEMEPWRVEVIDDEGMDPASLRRYQRTGKYDILLVDHLHRMRWKDRHDLENNIRAITNIAREFNIPVILLAQLSRAGDYAKPFPVPSMRQLRETAMLEAEASCVWFVYRERDEHHVQQPASQFIIAKNRYGRVGTEILYFDETTQTFQEQGWQPVVEPVDEFADVFPV